MPIKTVCPHCDVKISAPRRKAGQVGNCPKCGLPFTVPGTRPEPVSAAVGGDSPKDSIFDDDAPHDDDSSASIRLTLSANGNQRLDDELIAARLRKVESLLKSPNHAAAVATVIDALYRDLTG